MTVEELLPLYALDLLDGDDAKTVERALAADPKLQQELATYRDAAHELAAAGPALAPPREVEQQLLASIGGGRYERFSARVAAIFDVTVERARELLGLTERTAAWELPIPRIGLIHFDGGAACATADCGFVRISPGGTFPWHTHRGEELAIIIAGTLVDVDGKTYGPGAELMYAQGSSHELTITGDDDVIFVARAFNGIELGPRPQP